MSVGNLFFASINDYRDVPHGYPHNDYLDEYTIQELDKYNQNALIPSYNGIPLVNDEIEYEHTFLADDYDDNTEEMGEDIGTFLTKEIPYMSDKDKKICQFLLNYDPSRLRDLNKNAFDTVKRVISNYRLPYGGYGSVDWAHQDFAPGGFSVWLPIGYTIWDVQMHYQAEMKKAGLTKIGINLYKEVYCKREVATGIIGPTIDMLQSVPFIGWLVADVVELVGEISDWIRIPVYENIAFYGTMSIELIENNWDKIIADIKVMLEIEPETEVPKEEIKQPTDYLGDPDGDTYGYGMDPDEDY